MATPAYMSASAKPACIQSGPACTQFSGLRRSGFEQCMRVSSSFADLQQFVTARSSRGVVTMAGTGKFFVGGNWKCVRISTIPRVCFVSCNANFKKKWVFN